MKPIIRAARLSKQYRIGTRQAPYVTLRESLAGAVRAPARLLRRNGGSDETRIWALRDISFEVLPGEVVGIIGRNGAGKSTLLKILSRITEPTSGQVDLYGRVGSLLEVGTGFHPELTGSENIYLNGAILGMPRREIARKFDEIVSFAEVEKFIDTPVKHYSSGMYLRLAFAVAAHLEPEILLIDEVLAVGDYGFQQKCIMKAGQVAGDGKTVLLVSHNLAVLGEIAKTVLWLDKGKIQQIGPLQSVVQSYLSSGRIASGGWSLENPPKNISAFVSEIQVHQGRIIPSSEVMIDQPFEIRLAYTVCRRMAFCRVGVLLSNSMGTVILSTAEPDDESISPLEKQPGVFAARCTVPGWLLAPDTYLLTPHIDDAPLHRLFTAEQACSFSVVENAARGTAHYGRPGIIAPKLPWAISRMGESCEAIEDGGQISNPSLDVRDGRHDGKALSL
jgi:lipopolysaccharide transport system ATP-binding protein